MKISWRNWGSQLRVTPAQNIHAPKVLAATRAAMAPVLQDIAAWLEALPQDKRYLFAGIKLGWEAAIGWNAYCEFRAERT